MSFVLALQDPTTIESSVKSTFDITSVEPGPSLSLFPGPEAHRTRRLRQLNVLLPGPSIYVVMLHKLFWSTL